MIAAHTRSAYAVGAVKVYCPVGQLVLCVAQARSDTSVAAVIWYSSSPHLSASVHAAPSTMAENVEPSVHAAQVRSLLAVPSRAIPLPVGQVFQAGQCDRPGDAVKRPVPHAVQTILLLAVASAEVCSPAGQGVRTSLHAVSSLEVENVLPTLHGAHW